MHVRSQTLVLSFLAIGLLGTGRVDATFSVTNGLVSAYEFEQNTFDSWGASDAVEVGSPTYVQRNLGDFAIQTNPGNYAQTPSSDLFTPGPDSFSVALWFNIAQQPAFGGPYAGWTPLLSLQHFDDQGILLANGLDPGSPMLADHRITFARVGSAFPDTQGFSHLAPTPLINAWHHLTAVVDRSTMRLLMYLDGAEVLDSPLLVTGSIDPVKPMLFGAYDFNSARNGHDRFVFGAATLLDEVLLYNRPLSPQEIGQIYSGQTQDPAVPEPLSAGMVAGSLGLLVRRRVNKS